jgi:hypothetical protein
MFSAHNLTSQTYANFHDHLENNKKIDDIIQIEFKIQFHRLLKF